eukprot:CAMPEP_0196824410 /NCGR_PEP_ID=MMETSP1362-20130617/91741_1 /TAXON_ID=163516 /ORGANISM="Leptocylindrus danicus, Strain CCMP1856" /LENGTH=265 /DNA_ID=CAMNT_0042204663 /DNA_START=33 /DNA_END=830 /DNA_ORIENTATION=+
MKISTLFVLKLLHITTNVAEGFFAPPIGMRNASILKAGVRTSTSPVISLNAASSGDDDVVLVAADPRYSTHGPIGNDDFIVSREGGATDEEMSNENILLIVTGDHIKPTDLEVNTLIWKCLGYRFDTEQKVWTNEEVFPKWKINFPEPPDLIGMQRIYAPEIDKPSLRANQKLVKSIPPGPNKQALFRHLKPLGFTGFKVSELTPSKTRRAQVANWILYYREELHGVSIEELKERRRLRQEAEAKAQEDKEEKGDTWKYPLQESY